MSRPPESNLKLYSFTAATRSLLFWVSGFFIYFSSRLTVDQVRWLESTYYFTTENWQRLGDLAGRMVVVHEDVTVPPTGGAS